MIFSQSPARAAGGFVCRNERRSREDNGAGTTINRFFSFARTFGAFFAALSLPPNKPPATQASQPQGWSQKEKKEKLVSEKRTGRYVTLVPSDEGFRVLFHWTKSLELL